MAVTFMSTSDKLIQIICGDSQDGAPILQMYEIVKPHVTITYGLLQIHFKTKAGVVFAAKLPVMVGNILSGGTTEAQLKLCREQIRATLNTVIDDLSKTLSGGEGAKPLSPNIPKSPVLKSGEKPDFVTAIVENGLKEATTIKNKEIAEAINAAAAKVAWADPLGMLKKTPKPASIPKEIQDLGNKVMEKEAKKAATSLSTDTLIMTREGFIPQLHTSVIPLNTARAVRQKVSGTSSTYVVVAVGPVNIAARLMPNAVSLRAEPFGGSWKDKAVIDVLKGLGFSLKDSYMSCHFTLTHGFNIDRLLGSVLLASGIQFDQLALSHKVL